MQTRPDRISRPDSGPAGFVERWWAGQGGPLGRVLDVITAPLEFVYRSVIRRRNARYERKGTTTRVAVPVVSIGNVSVGGAGKTPVTRWLAEWAREQGVRPAVLHGGYAADEPELHRRWNPDISVYVGRDRVTSAREAIADRAELLLLDDGFQHRRLDRDVDLVLVAAESWHATPKLLPRGPWREPPSALRRADLVAVTRKSATLDTARAVAAEIREVTGAEPVLMHLAPAAWTRNGEPSSSGPPGDAVAVAGIAGPEPFLENVRSTGVQLADALIYRDHHEYTPEDAQTIRRAAAGRALVTTAKDAVKLDELLDDCELWVLEQEVIIEAGHERLIEALTELLTRGEER